MSESGTCIDCKHFTCNGITTRVNRQFIKLPEPAVICVLCHTRRWELVHVPTAAIAKAEPAT